MITYSFDQYFGENNKQLKEQLKEQLKTKSFIDLNKLLGFNDAKSKVIATIESDKYSIKTLVTYHLDDKGNKVSDGAQVEIGGNDRYIATCRIHFNCGDSGQSL